MSSLTMGHTQTLHNDGIPARIAGGKGGGHPFGLVGL